MGGQNRLLGILLGVLAVLVLIVGGLTYVATQADDEGGSGPTGVSSDNGSGGGGSGGDAPSTASGRLRLASNDPVTLDPHLSTDALSAQYVVEIFGGLVTITPDLEIALDLAESVDVSDDGRLYTFRLRDDIFFHSGRRVTAEDVQWSLERASSPELASPVATAYLGDIEGQRERFFGLA
jgi:oligopeptide transport system substrate-binding protein